MPFKDKEAKKAYDREYARRNKECKNAIARKHYEDNKEIYHLRSKQWAENNPEKAKAFVSRWASKNKGKKAANEAKRRTAKLHRTPRWAELDEIAIFYQNCPEGYHVDHILPLQGKKVSGLHVLSNLQYLPASENCKKGNSFINDGGY